MDVETSIRSCLNLQRLLPRQFRYIEKLYRAALDRDGVREILNAHKNRRLAVLGRPKAGKECLDFGHVYQGRIEAGLCFRL